MLRHRTPSWRLARVRRRRPRHRRRRVRRAGALDAAPRTIPYSGYVDFDGQPVNAGAVQFNFALFPCASPGTGAAQCQPLWLAKGAWNAAGGANGFPAGATVGLPIFGGRFSVELGAAGQTALPDAVFDSGHETLYLAIQIEGKALGTLQKVTATPRAWVASEADRFRVRSEVAIDDDGGGQAMLIASNGLVVGHTVPDSARLTVEGPVVATSVAAATGGTITFGDGLAKKRGTLKAAGILHAEGGSGDGPNVSMMRIDLDLSGMAGRWMHVYGSTAMSEVGNTSDVAILRVVLDDGHGNKTTIAAQRHTYGAHGSTGDPNLMAFVSAQGYIEIPAAYAIPGASVQLVGGIDAGAFSWGRAPSYTVYDGEQAGGTLGYAIF
ncbi:MAG: hypothetical protein U1F43_30535 [Myxococcota bacterium]